MGTNTSGPRGECPVYNDADRDGQNGNPGLKSGTHRAAARLHLRFVDDGTT